MLSAHKLDISGNKSTLETVGKFKGLIRITPMEDIARRKKKLK